MPASRDDWRAFFAQEQIELADCLTAETPFDHPNAVWSTRHAACLARAIGQTPRPQAYPSR